MGAPSDAPRIEADFRNEAVVYRDAHGWTSAPTFWRGSGPCRVDLGETRRFYRPDDPHARPEGGAPTEPSLRLAIVEAVLSELVRHCGHLVVRLDAPGGHADRDAEAIAALVHSMHGERGARIDFEPAVPPGTVSSGAAPPDTASPTAAPLRIRERLSWLFAACAFAFLGHGLFADSGLLDAVRLHRVGRTFDGELLGVDSMPDVVGAGTRFNFWGLLQTRELRVRFSYVDAEGGRHVIDHRASDDAVWQRYAARGEGPMRVVALASRPSLAMPADDIHFDGLELSFSVGMFGLSLLALAFALGVPPRARSVARASAAT